MKKLLKVLSLVIVCTLAMVFANVWNIKADTVNDRNNYIVDTVSKTVTFKVTPGTSNNGKSFGGDLQAALEAASDQGNIEKVAYKVVLPAGNYNLDITLHLYGYVYLDATGSTITYTSTKSNMLMTGSTNSSKYPSNTDASQAGYGTYTNMAIIGGTWVGNSECKSTLIRMSHCSNVSLINCVFSGGNCPHQVEVCSIDTFNVTGCTFADMKYTSDKEGKSEALQFDMPVNDYVFNGVVYDGTPMKNVTVDSCKFVNVPRGVGSHTALVGSYHTNMVFTNNSFENVTEECIVALQYLNCTIKGNVIKNCGAGILIQNGKPSLSAVYSTIYNGSTAFGGQVIYDLNTSIEDNTIELKKDSKADEVVGIKLYGKNIKSDTGKAGYYDDNVIKKNNYYVGGVTVANNKITTYGHGIHLMDASDCTISNNSIENKGSVTKYDGIFIESESRDITVNDNKVNNSQRYGIMVQNSSSAKEITNNTVTNSKMNGIYIYNKSSVEGDISKNKVTNCGKDGIFLNLNCKAKNISNNSVKNCKDKGIQTYAKSYVEGYINNNTVNGVKKQGINVGKSSHSVVITGNTIKGCKDWPVVVDLGAKADVGVNTIKGNKRANTTLVKGKSNNGLQTTPGEKLAIKSAKAGGKVTWAKASGVDGYVVEYSTSKSFDDIVDIKVGASKTSAKGKGLEAGKTYYVRVCSYKKVNGMKVYGKYSSVKSFNN